MVVAGLVVLAGVGACGFGLRPDPITRENFGRIARGMSRAQVEAILGTAGDYRGGPTVTTQFCAGWDADKLLVGGTPDVDVVWLSDSALVYVVFLPGDGVVWKQYEPCRRVEQTPLDILLWRAKRLWHGWFPEPAPITPKSYVGSMGP